ncbi:hypothetical protein J4420_03545 [Candidatus Woesearchaeota archaeon]|nr:hypothetical protein [Candidatus Woesearchaeota archaeon]
MANSLKGNLLHYVAMISLCSSINSCKSEESLVACSTDNNCPGEQLCINHTCTSACATDYDCPGDMLCESNYCVSTPNSNNPSSNQSRAPRTAAQMLSGLETALRRHDVDKAVEYFIPKARQEYRQYLNSKNLEEVAAALSTATPNPAASRGDFQQYEFTVGDIQYPLIIYCPHEICYVLSL